MTKTAQLLLGVLASLALVTAGCGDDDSEENVEAGSGATTEEGGGVPEGPAVTIGAQDFGESAIMAEIYKQALGEAGYEVGTQSLGGFRDLEIAAFDNGEINFAPEYAASMLEFLNGNAGEATSDAEDTVTQLQTYLDEKELTALEPSDAVDTNSFVVTREKADELGLETLSDLAEKGADLTLGGPADCETNPFCIPGLQDVYGLDLSANFTQLEAGAVADALAADQIDVGVLFSTSGRIDDEGWVLLEDDETLLAADNIVPVVSNEVLDAYGDDFESLVDGLSGALTTEELTELNKRFDIDKEDAADIAADWLSDNG
ncbi:MAG: ABC transporter substrate-binding protein [Actinomycetota bacterium]|nr:ABC transporter substrate-binding protein [Actinomycetota bacterium]